MSTVLHLEAQVTAPSRAALAERLNRLATYLRAPGSRLGDRSAQDNWYEAGMCEAAAALLREPSERQVELETCDHPCVDCAAEDAEPRCADCASRLVMSQPTDEEVARAVVDASPPHTHWPMDVTELVRAVRAAEQRAKEAR